VLFDATQNLRTVDLAQHDVLCAHSRDGVENAPTVAMELRECVKVHIAIVDAELPAERDRVQPDVAVRQLHTLRSCSGAASVVDRCSRILVVSPRNRLRV